jgi:hypothetical protein
LEKKRNGKGPIHAGSGRTDGGADDARMPEASAQRPQGIRSDAYSENAIKNNGLGAADVGDADAADAPSHTPEPLCKGCGIPAGADGQLVACGPGGSAGLYHLRCWTEERTRRRTANKPALGPLDDSLEDLK